MAGETHSLEFARSRLERRACVHLVSTLESGLLDQSVDLALVGAAGLTELACQDRMRELLARAPTRSAGAVYDNQEEEATELSSSYWLIESVNVSDDRWLR